MTIDFQERDRRSFDLSGKVVVVVGGGRQPGPGMGNGRAISILAARHGAEVVAVDRNLGAAEETVGLITGDGGRA